MCIYMYATGCTPISTHKHIHIDRGTHNFENMKEAKWKQNMEILNVPTAFTGPHLL